MKNVTGKHFVLTLCLVFCMVMFAAGAVAEQREVATAAELKAALADTACDRIVVTADFSVSESMKITNPSVNIDLGGHTLTATELTAGYNLFDVGEGKTLNLSNGTLKSSHEGANAGFRAVLGRSGSSVELDSLTIEKFGGVYAGGAVLAYGNSLKVNECTIQGCGANVGGAIATHQLNETVLTGNMLADNYTQAGMGNIEIPDPVNHPDETVVLDMEDIARDLSPFSGTNSGCGGALGYVSRYNGALRMEGNTIQNNRAENRGGGIYFYAPDDNNTIDLTSGSFLGNSAKWGGAIDYSNHLQTALQLNNVLITENKAARGGGVWICPQSALNIAYNLSGSIYGNTASGTVRSYYGNILDAAGDDICVEGNDSEDIPRTGGMSYESGTVVNVIGRGLGGVETRWYVDSADKRYTVQPEEADESLYFNMTNSFALHGEVDPELIGLIESEARLVFRGNTATERGGAIASNSPLNIGASEYPTVFVTVRKAFKGLDNTEDAPPVKAILYRVDASGHRELIQKDILLNKENGWYVDLGELPSVYVDENGVVQHYTYSVGEETLDGYVLTDISQKKNTRITGTIKVPNETDMKNYWDSADLTVHWMKAGTEETVGEAQRMYAGNRWCVSWSVLAENFTPPSSGTLYNAKWDDNGTLRPVEEAFPMSWVIEGYGAGAQWVDADSQIITVPPAVRRFRLQNPLKTSQAVIDNWNSIGFSPKLTVRLWQFSEDVTRYWLVDSIELNKENNWSIPAGREYDSPNSSMPIDYYPSSFVVMTPEYSESYTDQYDFTLTNEPSKVIHRAEKKWNGAEGNAVTVRLLADGEPQGADVTLSAESWQHEWPPVEIVDADGNRREYTLEEDPVAGYSTDYKDEWKNQVSVAPVPDVQLISATGYTAVLTQQAADTTQQEIGSVQLTADSGYQHVWNDLAYADERGNTYTYILQVHPADHPEVDAADLFALKVQNIHILRVINTELTKVTGTKTWMDGGKEHDNAAEITLVLKRTSAKAGEETVTAAPDWNGNTYTYSNLPKYDKEGYEYTYTVSETPITGYTIARTGNNFTNTITGTVEVKGTKTWVDGGKEHDNAAEITLVLKRTSAKAGEETVTAAPAWNGNTYTYSNLPKYDKEGYEYTYTVSETPITGYTIARTGNNFTNTITGTVEVKGTKTWVDGGKEHDNAAEITLVLKRTSAKAGEETVTAAPAWNGNTYTYSNLPKYDKEGYEYTYTVSETPITGYTIARTGNDFTNTITGTVEVKGTKTWVDGGKEHDNAAEITLVLKRTSAKAGEETVTAAPAWNGNTYTYSNLPKYDGEGYEYTYSVAEEPVAGYAVEQEGNDFTNTLQIVTIDPPVEKKVSGENAPEAVFTFQMTGEQDAPMPEGSTDGQKTIEQNGPGKVEFGEIEYTEPGEWQYEIREIPGDTEGYQYDDTVWQLTVKVSAAQDGLVAEVTAAAEGKAAETAVFENVYAVAETTTPPTEAPDETDEPEPTETPAPEPTEKPEPVIPPEPTWTPNEFYFSFTKSWRGTPQDSISFTLHNPNGTVKQHRFNQRKISDTEWLYEAWLSSAADYYVVENPVEGYTIAYINVGEHAGEKDRVYNGGTIINYDIPKTGDTAYPAFWMAMAAIGLCGIGMLVFDHRKKHLDKTAQR